MTSWILYWRRGRNGALRNFLQHVVAADGFDDFLFGVVAVVLIVVAVVAFGSGGELVRRSSGVAFTGVLDMRRVVGMGRVFARVFVVMMLIMSVFGSACRRRLGGGCLDRRRGGHAGFRDRRLACGICAFVRAARIVIVAMIVIVVIVRMVVIVTMRLVIMRIMVVMSRIRPHDARRRADAASPAYAPSC